MVRVLEVTKMNKVISNPQFIKNVGRLTNFIENHFGYEISIPRFNGLAVEIENQLGEYFYEKIPQILSEDELTQFVNGEITAINPIVVMFDNLEDSGEVILEPFPTSSHDWYFDQSKMIWKEIYQEYLLENDIDESVLELFVKYISHIGYDDILWINNDRNSHIQENEDVTEYLEAVLNHCLTKGEKRCFNKGKIVEQYPIYMALRSLDENGVLTFCSTELGHKFQSDDGNKINEDIKQENEHYKELYKSKFTKYLDNINNVSISLKITLPENEPINIDSPLGISLENALNGLKFDVLDLNENESLELYYQGDFVKHEFDSSHVVRFYDDFVVIFDDCGRCGVYSKNKLDSFEKVVTEKVDLL